MKKLLLTTVFVFLLGLSLAPLVVTAAQLCPSGNDGDCSDVGGTSYECDTSQQPFTCVAADAGTGAGTVAPGGQCKTDGDCSGNLACINKVCQIDKSLEDPGTAAAGGACGMNDANGNPIECPGGQTCTNNVCVGSTGAPSAPSSATGGSTFVPLAPIPGLTDTPTNNLATFFNNLYKFCIGAAAVLAILEITMGGFQVMSGDSITAHSDGRDRIVGAILGLVLVLSPFLIFSIINPSILSLQINTSGLQPTTGGSTTGNGSGGSGDTNNGAATGTNAPSAPSNLHVTAQTATSVTLAFTAPSGGTPVAGYDVYNGSTLAQSVTGTTATITVPAGSQNTFTVKARDSAGNTSPASNSVGVETVTVTAPGAGSYFILSGWYWYDNGAIAANDTTLSRKNCWYYHINGTYQNNQVACQQDMATFGTGSVDTCQGCTKPHIDYQCTASQTGTVSPKTVAPGPAC
jgi:hypothetical protein